MNGIKKKKKKSKKPKKVLLSIVDPWDVKVASVDPIRLATRRGISLSEIPTSPENGSQNWSLPKNPIKIPSPWYKPGTSSANFPYPEARRQFESHSACNLQNIQRSPTSGTKPESTSLDELVKQLRTEDRRKRKAESDFPDGFKNNTNVDNSVNDTARVRFANEKETNSEIKFNGSAPYTRENIPVGDQRNFAFFEHHFPSNITITVEEYPSDNTSKNNVGLKPEVDKDPLESIVQDLVQSRYSPLTSARRRNRRSPSPQTRCKIEEQAVNEPPLSPFNEIDVVIPKTETHNNENSSNTPPTTEIVGLGAKIRKTSISMPSKLDDMDDLRIDDQKGTSIN